MAPYIIMVGIFSGSLTIAAVLASKIVSILGFFVPAGVFAYCITFVCTDVMSEVWGKRHAQLAVLAGFVTLVIVMGLSLVALHWTPAPFWTNQEGFASVIGMTPRIAVGSLCAYLLSQYHDVWLFHLLKRTTNDKHLWLRNNLSTAISQLLDSVVFIVIAFYGVMPIWPLILGQWVVKLIIAALDTPVVYGVVHMLRCRMRTASEMTA
jgi:uncharacterized integral membrane protein (TIGR00697 family)